MIKIIFWDQIILERFSVWSSLQELWICDVFYFYIRSLSKVKWRKFDPGFYHKQLVKLVRINRCQFTAELKLKKFPSDWFLECWQLSTLKLNKKQPIDWTAAAIWVSGWDWGNWGNNYFWKFWKCFYFSLPAIPE